MPALNQTTYNHNYQQHVPLPPPVSSQPLTQQNVPQQIQPQRSGSAQTPQFAPVSASSRQPVGNMQTRQAAPQVLVQQKLPFPKGEEQYTKFKGQYIFCTNGSQKEWGDTWTTSTTNTIAKIATITTTTTKSSISTTTAKQLEDIRGSKIHQQMQQPQLLLQKPQPNHKTSKDSSTPPPPPPLPPKIKKCRKISLNLMKSLGY